MKEKNRGISTSAIVVIVVIIIIAVGVGAYYAIRRPGVPKKKIGLILATGGLGDKSFNDESFWGCQDAAKDFSIKLDYVEPREIAEYEGYETDMARSGEYSIIVCIGFDQAPYLTEVAAKYPSQRFAIVDAVAEGDNIASLLFNDWEGAFLVGVVAGSMTKTNKVAMLGGMDIPLIRRYYQGYTQGALWANPEMSSDDVIVRYVGEWNDPTTGYSLTGGMYESGADICYAAAGKSGLGVFSAAEENPDWWAIGTDVDQAWSAPEHADIIIASEMKDVRYAVYSQIEKVVNGEFTGGIVQYGMHDVDVSGGVGIYVGSENISKFIRASQSEVEISDDVLTKVKNAVAGIQSGTIVIEHE